MATINVILQAKARDKGVHKWLTTATKLADGFAESLGRAKSAMGGLGSGMGSLAAAGRGRGGSGKRGGGGGGRDTATSFDKAMRAAQRSRERTQRQESRDAQRQVAALARAGQQRVRASQRAAKNLQALSDEQLREREIQREINTRRTRAARSAAKASLGADPTKPGKAKMGPFGKLEFAENLAVAGGEFEQFGSRVEQGIRGSFDAFRDYEKAVVEVSTLTDQIPIDQIQKITKDAAEEFGGLPTDQVKGFYSIVSAGATNAADAQAQLTAANKLAIGGVATQEDAVLAISKSVANFKDQGVDATQAADSLFTAVKRGQTTVEEMARALPNVASSAAAAGLSLDQTNAALAVLSTRLPNAKEGATSLKAAFSNLQKPTKGAREEAKRLGIDFSVAGIEAAGGFEEFLLKLRAAEKFDENTLSKLFDSSEARAAISGLISGMDDYRSVLADMENKQGAADKAYSKMADTTAQKSAKVEAQMELLKIQAGEELVPVLLDLSNQVLPIIKGMRDWAKENPNTASTIAKLAVGIAVAAKGVGALTSAYSMWQTISAMSQLGNMKLTSSTNTLTSAVTKQGTAMSTTAKLGGGLSKFAGALPGIFALASAGIVAFNLVLDQAQKSLAKYEDKLKAIEEEQKTISFKREATSAEQTKFEADKQAKLAALEEQRKGARGKKRKEIDAQIADVTASTLGPVERSDAELLMERRNRLIATVNASRTAASESRVGGVSSDANILEKSLGGWAGKLNQVTGVTDEIERQRRQAEIDLARFDQQYGEQLNLGEAAFSTAETESKGIYGDAGMLAELAKIAEATQAMATNTRPNVGPSMEAGMPS